MFTSRLIEKVPLPIQVPVEVKRPKPQEKHDDGEYEETQAPQGAIAG